MTPRPAARDTPEAARFFLALGDATRLALLGELREGEKTVGELVDALGCPQPKVSRHLKVLKDVGLVHDHKEGRHVRYGLATASIWPAEARRWVEELDAGLQPPELMPPRPRRKPPLLKNAPATPRTSDLEDFLL